MERHFRRGIGAKITMLVLGLVAVFLVVGIVVFMGLRQTGSGIAQVQALFDTAEKITALNVQGDELRRQIDALSQNPQGADYGPLYTNIATQKASVSEVRSVLERQPEAVAAAEKVYADVEASEAIIRSEFEPAAAAGDVAGMAAAREKLHDLHILITEGTITLLGDVQREIAYRRSQNVSMLGRSRMVLQVGLIFAVVGGLSAGFLVSGRISRRLKRLGSGVEAIRQGELKHRVQVNGNDEVAELSQSFNAMAEALESRTTELQLEQNHIRSVHQGIADGIIVFDRLGRVTSVNAAAEVAIGQCEDEIAGKWNMGVEEVEEMISMPELVSESDRVRCREVLGCHETACPAYESTEKRCWMVAGTFCQGEERGDFSSKRQLCERCPVFMRNCIGTVRFSRRDRHYSVSASPILDDQGIEQGRLAVIHDVTEIRAAELAALKRNRELALLNEISTYIGRAAGDLGRVSEDTIEAIRQAMDVSAAAILLTGRGSDKLEIMAGAGFSPEMSVYLDRAVMSSEIMELTDEEGAFLKIDTIFERYPESRELLKSEGLKQPLVAMIWGDDRAIGLLAVVDERKNAYPPDERQLLKAVAAQLGVAIRNIELINGIKKAKKEWEVTFDAMTDGVAILDGELNIIRSNFSMAGMLQVPMTQVIGRKGHEIYPQAVAADVLARQQEVIRTGRQAMMEVETGGSEKILRLAFDPVIDADEKVVGLVNIASDVTEQRQLREQLLQSEKMAAMGQLVAGVAHELNNPLTGIMGYAELLLRHSRLSEGETGRDLKAIRDEAERASRIVHNLLSFARKQPAQKVYADINTAVRTVVELRRYELNINNIEIDTDLDGQLPRTLADQHQIEQVLLNMINNAEQAILEDGKGGRISISTSVSGRKVRLVVEDDGPGIDPGLSSQIFNPFFTTKEVGKGTGLGLSICYGIVKDHGGDIRVESGGDRGARFVLELPVTQPPVTLVESRGPDQPGKAMARRVLVVDDEPAIVDLLCDILTMEGHGVDVAESGTVALTKLGEVKYDSVITDIKMPEMDGRELHQKICHIDPELAERVIFITGDTVSAETRRYLNRTGNLCLMKPFNLEELRMKLQRMLNRNGN